jgi:hypothetical protein
MIPPLSLLAFALVAAVLLVLRLMAWRNVRAMWRFPAEAPTAPPSNPGGVGRDAAEIRDWPSVTIIVPARDEAAALPGSLAAWAALDYPDVEVVLVNDHSRDATGPLMDEAARRHPDRFRVLHDPPLPSGWLGKNNALWRAARLSTADWLLLTDADIIFAPDVVRRAVGLALARDVDLLPALIRVEARSWGERLTLPFLCSLGMAGFPIASGMNPRSRDAMGVGGFTLVRRDTYFRVGGHRAIASEVVEDVEFARLCKRSGARYGMVDGTRFLRVRMYDSLAGVVRGFRKNTFAALERSVALAALASAVIAIVGLLPLGMVVGGLAGLAWASEGAPLAWVAFGVAAWAATADFVWRRSAFAIHAPLHGALLHPMGAVATLLIVVLSTWDGVVRRRVFWRGRTLHLSDATTLQSDERPDSAPFPSGAAPPAPPAIEPRVK